MTANSISLFHPAVQSWFLQNFKEPTPPQAKGWPVIARGVHTLLLAPTGSGKTLAAFLHCLDWLYREAEAKREIGGGVRVLYISPLKALNNDIYHNLELPLTGIEKAARALGIELPHITKGVRTGDTSANERRRLVKTPPQILITTPESLFLMLSSKARSILKTVRFLIIDEIHNLFPNKRGAHLALSLARLSHLVGVENGKSRLQRIGLSATINPLPEVAAYLGGREWNEQQQEYIQRYVEIIDTGLRKELDVQVMLPVPDMHSLPAGTIWPSIYRQLISLIGAHKSTLVFVNNRRLGERITANINHLAGKEIARTHHGSLAREVRQQAEAMLRAGELPCIVATASLELGIDIGHIELVVQVESPKEVSRGLQRVGRAGHVLGLKSKGRILPKTRADLLETTVVLREMLQRNIEKTKAPQNPLDVLAQQLVAMTTEGDWAETEMLKLVHSTYNYRNLPPDDFQATLAMLSGEMGEQNFIDLKPRLYWDRSEGIVRPDPYGKRLVYTAGGTIPDRGYYHVYLGKSGVKLGELDEEFVYERRIGERFRLGTSTWRLEEIRRDHVIVKPAGRGEAMVPFWRAEQGGRSFYLGSRMGQFLDWAEKEIESDNFLHGVRRTCRLDEAAAKNLYNYLQAQKEALGLLPTHKRVIMEEFSDELGDTRLVLHTPFGLRTHQVLGFLLQEVFLRDNDVGLDLVAADDGLMLRYPVGASFPAIDWQELAQNLEERVVRYLANSAMFGVTFRHCAQRALVLPRGGLGRRMPLWLARLKATNLLEAVSHKQNFPLVRETYRSLLQDYLPLDELKELLTGLDTGQVAVHHCRRSTPSPFATTLMLEFTAGYFYEGRLPRSEKSIQLFGLSRKMLKTIVGEKGLRHLFTEKAIHRVTEKTMGLSGSPALSSLRFLQWLERLGDLHEEEIPSFFPEVEAEVRRYLEQLTEQGKTVKINELIVPSAYRDVYEVVISGVEEKGAGAICLQKARRNIIGRYARTRGPFNANKVARRYGIAKEDVAEELHRLAAEDLVESGAFTPGQEGEEWCDVGVLKEIHRLSLAQARREVKPRKSSEYGTFLASWQGIRDPRQRITSRIDHLADIMGRLTGLSLAGHLWERAVLPRRVPGYQPGDLDALINSGRFAWRASFERSRLLVSFFSLFAGTKTLPVVDQLEAKLPGKEKKEQPELSAGANNIMAMLKAQGAMSTPNLLQLLGIPSDKLWQGLEELMGQGLITNDTFGPVRYLLGTRPEQRKGVAGIMKPSLLVEMGRWSVLTPGSESIVARLLERYGVLCREVVAGEGYSWQDIYPVLDALEVGGELRRGYFVRGLGGIQFASSRAVDGLRAPPPANLPCYWALHVGDPANHMRFIKDKALRAEYLVFRQGEPVIAASGRKLKLQPLVPSITELEPILCELITTLYPFYQGQKIVVTHYKGQPVVDSPVADILTAMGFERGFKQMTLWPSDRKGLHRPD